MIPDKASTHPAIPVEQTFPAAEAGSFQDRPPAPPSRPERILFLFFDGVGIGTSDTSVNPMAWLSLGLFPLFSASSDETSAIEDHRDRHPEWHALSRSGFFTAVDARLETPGLPQSATGQASLFTGLNAAKFVGHHLTAFPTPKLGALVRQHNLLVQAARLGRSSAFLNTYTPRFYELDLPHSVSTHMAHSLNRPTFMLEDMQAGRSLFHDLTQEGLRAFYGMEIPVFSPYEGGARLARAAAAWDISIYEHFLTDHVGHKKSLELGIDQARRVESFLLGVLETVPLSSTLVLLCSDHGNLENARTRGHTMSQVPLSAWGPGADWLVSHARSILEVTPRLLQLLEPLKAGG